MSKKIVTIIVAVVSCICLLGFIFLFITQRNKAIEKKAQEAAQLAKSGEQEQEEEKVKPDSKLVEEKPKPVEKSPEEKQKVMEADGPTMDALGLRFDYANLDLTQVIQAYMTEMGIEPS